ncbi:MAG: hypothetical protein L0Y78_06325 [candidate division NC10 bacterium]|nr:hypothetical protein [candidate division NC10 bacterium]
MRTELGHKTPTGKRTRHVGSQGFTAIEMLGAVVLTLILVGVGLPVMMTSVESARFSAAVRQVVGDMHLARSKAVTTRWEYRIRGRDRRGGANANRYRVEGRRTPATAWPAEAATVQQTADLFVGRWINLGTSYPGIQLDNSGIGTNPPFYAGFDASGKICMPLTQCFDGVSPLVITKDSTGQTRQISIAPATGHVRVQ